MLSFLLFILLLYYQSNNCRTAKHALQYCLWCKKQNSFHNVITMDDLIKNYLNWMYFLTTVPEIWSVLLIVFDLLKNTVCIPCQINNNWIGGSIAPVDSSSYSLKPLAIQWSPLGPVTIYRPLGWSNWSLGINIDHFENHWFIWWSCINLQQMYLICISHISRMELLKLGKKLMKDIGFYWYKKI